MNLNWDVLNPRTSALDFAPEIIAVQKRPPAPLPRLVLYVLMILIAVLLIWSFIGKLDIVATAQGKLVPSTYLKIVQPADSGVVKEILVREGDRVRAGQLLLRLDTTISLVDRNIVANEVQFRKLQLRRIEAEISGRQMSLRDGEVQADLYSEVEMQARARSLAYQNALVTERSVLVQAEEELQSAQAQVVKLEQVLPLLRGEAESLRDLAARGMVPKFQSGEKQREHIESEQNLASQRRTVASLQARVAASRARIDSVTSQYREQLFSERVEAQAALTRAEQELAKQQHRNELSELRAPQDGVIKDVVTYTVGAVVSAGTVLMSLVPVDEELVAEVMVANEDVGFVHEGQSVKIKLAAFPFQKYGMVEGTVMRIAADAAPPPSEDDAPDEQTDERARISPYKVIIKLERQQLIADDSRWPLVPGMQVAAEIKQGTRTVMEYLLSPVSKALHEAARER
jgi:HlyD family secretion protein